jgi:hypothetical protein
MTIMRNTILAAMATMAAAGMAQAADFSGSWVRASAPAAAAGYPTYWLVRSEPIGQGGGQNYVMEVKQQGNALQVVDPTHPARSITADGRARTARADSLMVPITRTASMDDDTMTIVTTGAYGEMPGNVSSTETQTWALSRDKKVLTISTARVSPGQTIAFSEVFTRK